jgi:hypothetical protein
VAAVGRTCCAHEGSQELCAQQLEEAGAKRSAGSSQHDACSTAQHRKVVTTVGNTLGMLQSAAQSAAGRGRNGCTSTLGCSTWQSVHFSVMRQHHKITIGGGRGVPGSHGTITSSPADIPAAGLKASLF